MSEEAYLVLKPQSFPLIKCLHIKLNSFSVLNFDWMSSNSFFFLSNYISSYFTIHPWKLKRMPFTSRSLAHHILFLSQSFPFHFFFVANFSSSFNVFFYILFLKKKKYFGILQSEETKIKEFFLFFPLVVDFWNFRNVSTRAKQKVLTDVDDTENECKLC